MIDDKWERKILNFCCLPFDEKHTGQHYADKEGELHLEWQILDKASFLVADSAFSVLLKWYCEDKGMKEKAFVYLFYRTILCLHFKISKASLTRCCFNKFLLLSCFAVSV